MKNGNFHFLFENGKRESTRNYSLHAIINLEVEFPCMHNECRKEVTKTANFLTWHYSFCSLLVHQPTTIALARKSERLQNISIEWKQVKWSYWIEQVLELREKFLL